MPYLNKNISTGKDGSDLKINLLNCRCGGQASKPKLIDSCSNRWIIRCQVKRCCAYNIGQGLMDTVQGWDRLSTHFYR
jgi:hypothetical protein